MQILLIMLIVVLLAFSVLLLACFWHWQNKVPGKSRQKTKSRKNTSGIMQKQ